MWTIYRQAHHTWVAWNARTARAGWIRDREIVASPVFLSVDRDGVRPWTAQRRPGIGSYLYSSGSGFMTEVV